MFVINQVKKKNAYFEESIYFSSHASNYFVLMC
jgi:hypothetical protein